MKRFVGVDLGWYGKPTGLASLEFNQAERLRINALDRLEGSDEVLEWIQHQDPVMVAVDAPLVIPNPAGIRDAERGLNADFRRFHAGCHAANLGRPFASRVLAFSRRLEALGYQHGVEFHARNEGRYQIEVHPHSATIGLFHLPRIVKYKRGLRADRARELGRLRRLMTDHLPRLSPPLDVELPVIPRTGPLKPVEDRIDAVLCAYVAAHWWFWGKARNRVYGSVDGGYIVTPA